MPLHRLAVPTYTGGLPGTHDYINDPATNGDPGAPAPADGKKGAASPPGDLNEGTYFVAFSEPAYAANINRGLSALAENTDFLDDVIHADLAIPATLSVAAGHGGTNSFTLTGDIYVGSTGATDDYLTRSQLVEVVKDVDGTVPTFLLFGTPFPCIPELIHDGALASVVGSGFYTDPVVNLTGIIPDSVGFKVNYFVRGRVKDQPEGLIPTANNNSLSAAALSGYVATLQLFAALKNADNTFDSGSTQTFAGPVILQGATLLDKPATTAAFINTDSSLKRVLVTEFRVHESPDVFARLYKVRNSGGSEQGLEVTFNAAYVSDSAPQWASDSTSTNYHPTRFKLLGAGFSFDGEGLFYEVLDNGTLGAGTWNDSVWGASNVRFNAWTAGSMLSGDRRVVPAAFEVAYGPTGAPDGGSENPYKLVFKAPSGAGQYVRFFSGDDADAGGTGGLGHFVITHNADWNPSTKLWSRDITTNAALALAVRSTDDPTLTGLSGLSGSTTPGADSNSVSAFVLLTKAPGAGTWSAQSWAKESNNSGHLRIAGEYAYASTLGGRSMKWFPNHFDFRPEDGSSWAIADAALGATGGAATGVTWVNTVSGEFLFVPLSLPYGAKITAVAAEVDPIVASSGNRLKIQLFRQELTTRDVTQVATVETDGTTTVQTLTMASGLPEYLQTGFIYFLRIRHALATGSEVINWVRIDYIARVNAPGLGEKAGSTFLP